MKTNKIKSPADAPELTDAWAIHEYKRILALLGKDRVNALDHSLLVDYAQTYADVLNLRATVEVEGIKLVSHKGGEYINPTLNVLVSRQTHLAQLRRDLYFTPRSRVERLSKTKGKAQDILDSLSQDVDQD